MFYCDDCAESRGWPGSWSRSYGTCEICGKVCECNDRKIGDISDGKKFKPVRKWPAPGAIYDSEDSDYAYDDRYDYYESEKEDLELELARWENLQYKTKKVAEDAVKEAQEAQQLAKSLSEMLDRTRKLLTIADRLANAAKTPVTVV